MPLPYEYIFETAQDGTATIKIDSCDHVPGCHVVLFEWKGKDRHGKDKVITFTFCAMYREAPFDIMDLQKFSHLAIWFDNHLWNGVWEDFMQEICIQLCEFLDE